MVYSFWKISLSAGQRMDHEGNPNQSKGDRTGGCCRSEGTVRFRPRLSGEDGERLTDLGSILHIKPSGLPGKLNREVKRLKCVFYHVMIKLLNMFVYVFPTR